VLNFFDHVLRDEYGLDPGVEPLSDGVEGMTWPDGRVLVNEETYCGADNGFGRPRFTVVHECYHGIKHRDQIRKALIDTGELVLYRRDDIKPYVDPEWQANTFASAVLMPEQMVRRVIAGKQRRLMANSLVEVFAVSLTAAEVRLKKLDI
jgi:Zn-dependent peptidase ImmA (M78 family)